MIRTARTWLWKALCLILASGFCALALAEEVPRLWEVKGKNKLGIEGKFYILPVTHNGLDVEYDGYFSKTILPVALKSDVFLQESAILVPSEMPSCPQPLPDTAENREILRQAYIDVERAEYDRRPRLTRMAGLTDQDWKEVQEAEHWFAHDPVSKLTEYGLIVAMGEILHDFLEHHQELSQTVTYKPRSDIADYIQHQRWIRGIKSNEPIERGTDLAEAYCGISPARRAQYLQREISRADPLKFTPMSAEKRATFSAAFVESIKKMTLSNRLADVDNDEFSEHFVCDRNEKWLAKMRDAIGTDVRFYAVGMGHVMQRPKSDHTRCDGLLKRLRDEGFTVTLLK